MFLGHFLSEILRAKNKNITMWFSITLIFGQMLEKKTMGSFQLAVYEIIVYCFDLGQG